MKTMPITATSRACALAAAMADAARRDEALRLVTDGGLAAAQLDKALRLVREWLAPEDLEVELVPAGDAAAPEQAPPCALVYVLRATRSQRPEEGLVTMVGTGA